MDAAYDHIAEQAYANDRSETPKPTDNNRQSDNGSNTSISAASPTAADPSSPTKPNLQTELQETFKAFSNSSWGTRLGGFWGNVRKQGESYYTEARKEVGDLGADALKWSEGVREKVVSSAAAATTVTADGGGNRDRSNTVKATDYQGTNNNENGGTVEEGGTSNELSSSVVGTDEDKALQENETFIERFKAEAAKRLKEVQKAEDAADEALLRFGTNIRNFLKDAVSVSAPNTTPGPGDDANEVLFESRDAVTGKRVIHTSRFDAQLHVIHTTATSFTQDPEEADSKEWSRWREEFDVDQKTDAIAKDLDKYTELRHAMERLVPEKVEYRPFWTRYYFLRHVVETQEEKRREMLKSSADTNNEEEVGWDDDDSSDDDDDIANKNKPTSASTSTLQQKQQDRPSASSEGGVTGRRSHDEKSVADSDASYDLVGGGSATPGSPRNKADEAESDEDWE